MKKILIEELSYLLKEAKKNSQPQPIFFLGAGASVSGNIPLAGDIQKHILDKFSDNPFVRKLKPEEYQYAKLMECLTPFQRNEILKTYIDNARINVTHIYLAQLLNDGYV
ncbi:hypothetical protein, partial [Persicitalea sp.]|uniref:hypothetical protein n=1 Tax=Persicitalea sp. TaxID=3100273 RepID=UPI0035938CC1